GDAAPGENHVERMAHPDQARQPHRAAVDQGYPETPAIDAEDSVARGHAKVAPEGELKAARNRMTFDGCDDRFAEQHAGTSERTVAIGQDAIAAVGGHGFEVGPGAKSAAGAAQNRYVESIVGVEPAERVGECVSG